MKLLCKAVNKIHGEIWDYFHQGETPPPGMLVVHVINEFLVDTEFHNERVVALLLSAAAVPFG